jgi:spore maturation protein SpmB
VGYGFFGRQQFTVVRGDCRLFIARSPAANNVYETFINGAKEGFSFSIRIIPYLVAILVAVGVLRTSGVLDYLIGAIAYGFGALGFNTDFVSALPVALMKPLSGSGARGIIVEILTLEGPDSFAGRLACVIQGASDTTFYILAVYFGAINITRTRHALGCCLLADLVGIVVAIGVSYLFFH